MSPFFTVFLNESVPYGFDSLGEVVIQVCYRRRHLPRCPNQTVLLWFWFLGRCHNTSVLSQKTSPKGSKSDFFLWFWFLGRSRNTSVLSQITWETLIWFGFDYLGDAEIVLFLYLGRCWDGLVLTTWEMLRWSGFDYLGDAEMVWFWSLGRRTFWFCKVGICKRLREFVLKHCLIWVPWEM